jgi:uncharacterized protein (DUF885 family)
LIFLPAFGFSLDSSLTLDQSKSEMRPYIQLFTADLEALDRYYSIPFAESRIKRFTAFYDDWLTRINQINFDGLSPEGKVDYILFENYLHFQKYKLERQQKSFREIEALIPLAAEIINLEESRKKIEKIEPPRVAELLSRISVNLESLKIQLETERPKSFLAFRAARVIDSLKEILKNWYEFYHGYDPLFTWWVEKPYAEAVTALEKYSTFLRDKIVGVKKGEITGEPVGREALIKELSFEMIPYTPEELIEIATKEMAWCEKMMIQASREMGFDSDWKKALEKVKREHVEPGQQAMLVKELALEAIDFLEKNNLITIPSLAKEIWRMEMMTPEQQLVNPFFTGGEVIRVSFPTDTMSHEAKLMSMRGNNIHFARATVHHELIPGHHLQGFMNARLKPYRRIFRTPFWTEGWALYWEMLLWDLGFPRTPENRMGMLFWRMHRCARVIFSLNFHLGKWSPQECIDFLVNRVGHERANAEAEVRRSFEGEYGSLYQLAYLIGALQFRALEKELVKTGKMTYREFHDAILMENNIPVEILRAILKKDTLRRDFRSTWKFYDGQIQ